MLPDALWYTGFFLLGMAACDLRERLWRRLSHPAALVVWGAASLATLGFPSHAAAPFYAAAGVAVPWAVGRAVQRHLPPATAVGRLVRRPLGL